MPEIAGRAVPRRMLVAPEYAAATNPATPARSLAVSFLRSRHWMTESNHRSSQCPGLAPSLSGFQVTLIGRFWMIPEATYQV
jgi:hypothetical protein